MSDGAGPETTTSTEAQSGSTGAPTFVVPTLKITQVRCTQKHLLKGLFVLFRPTPPPPAEKTLYTKVYEYVFGEEEKSPAPDPQYMLGQTDDQGYIGPPVVHEGEEATVISAVPATLAGVQPDAYKLMPGLSYDVYFIQHPSLELASKIASEINAGSSDYGAPHSIRVKTDEPVLEVPEDPATFIPKGADLYEGWNLYRDMPFAECQPVIDQVRRLQAHLGALRYMVGTTNWPYLPDVNADSDKSGGLNDGLFDVRAMNAVFRFQSDAQSAAFKVKGGGAQGPHAALVDYGANFAPRVDRAALSTMQTRATALKKSKTKLSEAELSEKSSLDTKIKEERADVTRAMNVANSWAYLDGEEVKAPAQRPDPPDGVVAKKTGIAIQVWLEQGLRKPGAILVLIQDPRTWSLWLRPEAAKAWHAWSELVKALGFEYGICVNHTFRSAQVDIGKAAYGRSARSIHKTGLAMDLGLTSSYDQSVPGWPVAYVHETSGERVVWRLYGPAKQALPTSDAASDAATIAAPIIERLSTLRAAQESSPIVSELLLPAIDTLVSQLHSSPAAFFSSYYKAEIQRWHYDAWDENGGMEGPLLSASQFFTAHRMEHGKSAEGAGERVSFLDLTAVGSLVNLSRISAFRSGWGQVTKSAKASDLTTFAKLLADANAHGAANDEVVIKRGKKVLAKKRVWAFDEALITQWNTALKAMKKEISKSVKVNHPQVTITLSWSPAKVEDAKKFAAKLREFSGKKFFGVLKDEGVPPVQSAEAWAQYIEERPAALEAGAPANQSGGGTSTSKAKVVQWAVTLQPIFEIGYTEDPEAASVADTVVLMPGDSADVPAPGQPVGMEWWHFQRSDLLGSGKSRRMWGDFLIEAGWTRECLLENTGPKLYYRAGVGYPEAELEKLAY